ncbi:MAG: MmgE/PrpD family protein, partial [Pseudolabrys sp.]
MDRRDILSLSATTAVGLIIPLEYIFAQVPASESEMKTLSVYMSAAGNRALPAEAAEQAKHHLLDTLSSMISGSDLPPGQAALRYIGSHAGKGAATIVGSAVTATPIDAALANGVMAHADET